MNTTIIILSGLLISVFSGFIGKYIGHSHKVSHSMCTERRQACQGLLESKIDNLASKVEDLKKSVDILIRS